jgi:hypothetical protein
MNSILLRKTPYSFPLLLLITLLMWFVPSVGELTEYYFLGYEIGQFWTLFISYIITLFNALIINKTLGETIFGNENSNSFVLFFIAIASISIGFSELIVLSTISLLLSISINIILNLEEKKITKNLFNAAFIMGFLSFLFVLFLPFIYLIGVGLSFLRRLRLVDFLVIIFSLLLPVILIYMISFISGNYDIFSSFLDLNFIIPQLNVLFFLLSGIIFLFSITGSIVLKRNRTFGGTKSIKASTVIASLFVLSYALGITNLFLENYYVFFTCISLSSGVYIASFFLKSNYPFKSVLLAFFLLACFVSKYFI